VGGEVGEPEEGRPELVTTVLLLSCYDVDEVEVAFEPEGMLHTLRKGDVFRVEAVLPAGREIEVTYSPGSIATWAEQTWGTRAFNRAGEPLQL
jgi:hypothetical protein